MDDAKVIPCAVASAQSAYVLFQKNDWKERSRAVHWEEQRAGEDSQTHTQTHGDDRVPGSRPRQQPCAPLPGRARPDLLPC
ncbi:hypothetical protein R6Z07M_019429 [Ovis aries]